MHVLVFVYWLGGDLGAFTASYVLTDSKQSPEARLAAAKILNAVDMAPRSALILALPTGLTLAVQRGWLALPSEALAATWIVSLLWLSGIWLQHARHAPGQTWRTIDLGLRLALIAGLLMAVWSAPALFLSIKFFCLALATALGILIRIFVTPMGPAIAELARGEPSAVANRTIATALGVSRPLVACIWLCLLVAAWAGIARPV